MPAKEDEIAAFRMVGRKIDEAAVEVFHLDTGRLELGDEQSDLVCDLLDRALGLLHASRVEATAVPRHLPPEPGEALPVRDEAPAGRDEPFDEGLDHSQSLVRLLLTEEPHTC